MIIAKTISFLTAELNRFLLLKMNVLSNPAIVMGNVSKAIEDNSSGTASLANQLVVSLVNIEEDRIAKTQENYTRTDSTTLYSNPPLRLNLYILIAANKTDYNRSLEMLGLVMQYFQQYAVITKTTHPNLDSSIEKLLIELYSLNFEQVNHLWSTLGGKYMPSVLYRVRQVIIQEDIVTAEAGFIKEIQISENTKPATS